MFHIKQKHLFGSPFLESAVKLPPLKSQASESMVLVVRCCSLTALPSSSISDILVFLLVNMWFCFYAYPGKWHECKRWAKKIISVFAIYLYICRPRQIMDILVLLCCSWCRCLCRIEWAKNRASAESGWRGKGESVWTLPRKWFALFIWERRKFQILFVNGHLFISFAASKCDSCVHYICFLIAKEQNITILKLSNARKNDVIYCMRHHQAFDVVCSLFFAQTYLELEWENS